MIEFILNNREITTEMANGVSLLDFIRKECHLPGTKIGCREGDCGACTVIEGHICNNRMSYKPIVSCLTPIINVHGKHIVTIEGLRMKNLSPVQEAIVSSAGTQCGYCTPGFVVSLTAHLLSDGEADPAMAIGGNICRCTGYKSIEKAAYKVDDLKKSVPRGNEIIDLVNKGWLPEYFSTIQKRLSKIKPINASEDSGKIRIGGGTDIMVQQYDKIRHANVDSVVSRIPDTVEIENGRIKLGAGISIKAFFNHQMIRSEFPRLEGFCSLIASEQIRNMGTLAGNIVNASPIGDLSILLLALNADLILENVGGAIRQIRLCDFFLDYKKTDLEAGEIVKFFVFNTLKKGKQVDFEKVSKRTYLDIATVNSAMSITVKNGKVESVHYAVGGVAPVPKYMFKTIAFLTGKQLNGTTLRSALEIVQTDISPISDIRGSKEYKRMLARQLFLQHFLTLFPEIFTAVEIHEIMTTHILPHEKY